MMCLTFVSNVISNAIDKHWNKASVDIINDHFNGVVQMKRTRPTNSEFISLIADNLRLKYKT